MPIHHPTIVIAAAVALYTLPSLIAIALGRRHQWGVVAFNLATGWTIIGWLAALRWALAKNRSPRVRAAKPLKPHRSQVADCPLDQSAPLERARIVAGWNEPALAPDLYAEWLEEGSVCRETAPAIDERRRTFKTERLDPRKAPGRKTSTFKPTSEAA